MIILRRPGRGLAAALTLALAACGGSSATSTPAETVAQTSTFSGTLSDGAVFTASLPSSAVGAAAAVSGPAIAIIRPATAVDVSGSVSQLLGGLTLALSGWYDPVSHQLYLKTAATPGYLLFGTSSGGVLSGSATTPTGGGNFVAMLAGAGLARYCGTYGGDRTGGLNLLVSGLRARAVVAVENSSGVELDASLSGTVAAGSVQLTDPAGLVTAQVAISGSAVTGTWQSPEYAGTLAGSAAACSVVRPVGCPDTGILVDSVVTPSYLYTALPAAVGGSISAGTYVLTALTYYNPVTTGASSTRWTLVIKGNQAQLVVDHGGTLVPQARTFSYSGTTLTIVTSQQCGGMGPPAGTVETRPYSSNGSNLIKIQDSDEHGAYELTFTKQ